MRSLIISLPKTSPLLFPIHNPSVIHKQQPIRHIFSYIRSLFIGIDVPLPPPNQAIITTQKHQHKLHLSYTQSDRYFLERTQQLCTKVGLLCDTLSFVPPTLTSTSTATPTPTSSTSHKHVIDLELLPDEWDDEFLQPQPLGSQTSPHLPSPPSLSPKQKTNKNNKKHVKIKTSRNITHHIPSITTHKHKHKHIQPKIPAPSSSSSLHYYTATPTITFAEWEKIPIHLHNLPYTFCIQCEKPIKHNYWYDHHMQAHAQKQSTTTTTPPPTTTPTNKTTTPTTTTTTLTPPSSSSTTTTTTKPRKPSKATAKTTTATPTTDTTATSTTTTTATKPTKPKKPSKATYTCPYSGCLHKFNPNTSHFVRDLNAHIDSYHDDTFLYDY